MGYQYFPIFRDFHLSARDPSVDVAGIISGAGAGKSYALLNEGIAQTRILGRRWSQHNRGLPFLCYVIEPTYPMIMDVALPIWFDHWKDKWTRTWSKSELKLVATDGSEVHFRSAERIDRIRGTRPNLILLDELRDMREYAFRVGLNRVSFRQGKVLFATTPNGYDWSYDNIEQVALIDPRFKVYKATAYDNPMFAAETLDRQRDLLGDELYEQEVLGRRIRFTGRVYRYFDPARHVDPVSYDPSYPLVLAFDFNVDPMSVVVAHPWGAGWQVFDEVVLRNSDTADACEEIRSRYPDHKGEYWIYADASGKAGHTSSRGTSDHSIIADYFGRESLRIPKANPFVRDRINAMNRLFRLGSDSPTKTRFVVDPRCKTLIKGLEQLGWKGNQPDEQAFEGHITAALGYAEHYERPFGRRGLGEFSPKTKKQLRAMA